MLEIRGIWLCHMSRWDRYVLRPRIWVETPRSGTVPHIGPYTYRLIFKIIMNAIKLTNLHKFLSVRIKIDARNMLRPGCYPFFFLLASLPPPLLFLLLHLRKEW